MTNPPSSPKIRNFAAAYVRLGAGPEAADQEVHRDQDDLEEDVEQEDVGGQEEEQRAGFHSQHQSEEDLRAVLRLQVRARSPGGFRPSRGASLPSLSIEVAPAGHDHHRRDDRYEEHQGEADAVQAERVVGPQWLDPGGLLVELHAAADLEPGGEDQRDQQDEQRNGERQLLGQDAPDEDQGEGAPVPAGWPGQ